MLWLKAFHIIFVVTWFAGLFYLPRLFVYHAQTQEAVILERYCVMERRLFAIMTIGGLLAAVFGLALLWAYGGLSAPQWSLGWWHAKVAGVVALIGYHIACYVLMGRLQEGTDDHSHVWYRWFNELPTLLLIGIVILVVVRPF